MNAKDAARLRAREARHAKAQALVAAYDFDAALQAYRALLEEDSEDVAALAQVAELARGLGRNAEAVAALERLLERYAADGFLLRAIGVGKSILSIDPSQRRVEERLTRLMKARETTAPPQLSRAPRRPSQLPTRGTTSVSQLLRDLDQPLEVVREEGDGLPSIPLFAALPKGAFAQILRRMNMREYAAGEVVVREGEVGRSFFVLFEGRVRVEKSVAGKGAVTLAYLDEGACFGEMSLLQDGPRTATVVADRGAKIAEIDDLTLGATTQRYPSVARALRDFYAERLLSTTMALHPFFEPFELAERRELARGFTRRSFRAGETLIREGTPGEGFYLLLSGRLVVEKASPEGPVELATLAPGDMFGEMSLLSNAPTSASVHAESDAMVLRLGRKTFERAQAARPELRALLTELHRQRLGENESRLSGRPGSVSR